jgi:hypothetical protein
MKVAQAAKIWMDYHRTHSKKHLAVDGNAIMYQKR